ncbi:MAG: heavy metal translocating P-type ATPase [Proteobacteria bacterium]|nr:heavy metal translocating P-type ATPase [Pseudomonadota bacterium]
MRETFILKGLDCPNCGAKIEHEALDIPGVVKSELNLIKQKLMLELDDAAELDQVILRLKAIVHDHEPDVVVFHNENAKQPDFAGCIACPHCESCHRREEEGDSPWRLRRLWIGGLLALGCIAVFYLFKPAMIWILPPLVVSYLILGGDVLLRAGRNLLKGNFLDENFLMALATIGAFAIGEYPEAVAVMLFYQIGEYFQDRAVDKSRRAISELMDIRPDRAVVIRDGEYREVSPEDVRIGEMIFVKPGEKIPLDGEVTEGKSLLDTRALTGESVPREIFPGEMALSGCVNQTTALTIRVTKLFAESTSSKIVDLVENASSRKAPAEHFITKFARYYTPTVVILAFLLAVIPPLFGVGAWSECVRRACIFLVISCPCALVISVPLTFFGGIGAASRRGVLVKGGNYLEALNKIRTIVFDKTGTLTCGNFEVVRHIPATDHTELELMTAAAHAEALSNHPIARSIMKDVTRMGIEVDVQALTDYTEISGQGTSVIWESKKLYAGNDKLMAAQNVEFVPCSEAGTKIYVTVDGAYLGCILIADEPKPDSAAAIAKLKGHHIDKTVMLTGDDSGIAQDIAKKLGIDEVFAELLPNQKVEKLEGMIRQQKNGNGIAFVGDGLNDAPVLARADVGIAMGGLGSDAAIEAADVVLMTDEPAKLVDAFEIAQKTRTIVMENIVFAISVKVLFLLLGAIGVIGLWPAVFADVGVMVLAVLNAMRMLRANKPH